MLPSLIKKTCTVHVQFSVFNQYSICAYTHFSQYQNCIDLHVYDSTDQEVLSLCHF